MTLSLTFVRFMHVVDGKEIIGMFWFPIANEKVMFTEQQLLKILKLNGYQATRIVHTDDEMVPRMLIIKLFPV